MSFTLVSYILTLAFVPLILYTRFKSQEQASGTYAVRLVGVLAIAVLANALAYETGMSGALEFSSTLAKVEAFSIIAGMIFLLFLSIVFPGVKKNLYLSIASWVAIVAAFVLVFFGQNYIMGISNEGGFHRIAGPFYYYFTYAPIALGALSAIILLIRGPRFANKIYRFQSTIFILAGIFGLALYIGMTDFAPEEFGLFDVYPLASVGASLIGLGIAVGFSLSRLFGLRSFLIKAAFFTLFSIAYGLIIGFVVSYAREISGGFGVAVLIAILAAAFFLIMIFREWVRNRFTNIFANRAGYVVALEKGFAALDYAKGRDEVIREINELLTSKIETQAIHILIESQDGDTIENVYSTDGNAGVFSRHNAAIELMLNNDITVLLKSEAMANHALYEVRPHLIAMFQAVNSDVLIMAKEGRHVIGFIGLGPKKSGNEYTSYDYDALTQVYAKIFVVVYYLKNIAKQSLITTVDRELEFSTQIIQSIQENIDKIDHPGIDVNYLIASTRKLGGDFLDIVKLSQDRYFLVLGDVSGKGLNASMSMVILKSVIRTFIKEITDFKQLVVKVNDFIKYHLPRGTFFAGVFGLFDFSKNSLYYINTGVPVMLLHSPSYNNIIEIQGGGKVLGFAKNIGELLTLKRISFAPGSVLAITTDGLLDSENLRGDRFGKERLERTLQQNKELNSERVVRAIFSSLQEFVSQEINDDVTIFCLKVLGR